MAESDLSSLPDIDSDPESLEVRLSLMASLVLNLPFWTGSKVLLYMIW